MSEIRSLQHNHCTEHSLFTEVHDYFTVHWYDTMAFTLQVACVSPPHVTNGDVCRAVAVPWSNRQPKPGRRESAVRFSQTELDSRERELGTAAPPPPLWTTCLRRRRSATCLTGARTMWFLPRQMRARTICWSCFAVLCDLFHAVGRPIHPTSHKLERTSYILGLI